MKNPTVEFRIVWREKKEQSYYWMRVVQSSRGINRETHKHRRAAGCVASRLQIPEGGRLINVCLEGEEK